MKSRIRHDVAIAAALILTNPLVNLLDEGELERISGLLLRGSEGRPRSVRQRHPG